MTVACAPLILSCSVHVAPAIDDCFSWYIDGKQGLMSALHTRTTGKPSLEIDEHESEVTIAERQLHVTTSKHTRR